MGHGHLLSRSVGAALLLAVPLTGCTGGERPAANPVPVASATTPPPGSDADLPLPAPAAAAPVEGVPAARVSALAEELASVWGVRVATTGGSVHGSGADPSSGVRFTVVGRPDGAALRGYACTAAPARGRFARPATGDTAPDPATLAGMETALGFLQTCANSSAADPDRATVWVRAVARQVLAGTPAQRRIGGVAFRLERSGGGLRLAVGDP